METQNVGSDLSNSGMDPSIPFNMVLLKEHTKYELIILTYRIAVIATGIVLIVLGYLLFANLVIDNDNAQSYYKELSTLAPGAVFAIVGLLFCVSGITKLMPLPKFERLEGAADDSGVVSAEVPTLAPLTMTKFTGKLWENNVKPIMEKVANNESVSRSDRELLKNWLRSL
jgi:hypothetical protein